MQLVKAWRHGMGGQEFKTGRAATFWWTSINIGQSGAATWQFQIGPPQRPYMTRVAFRLVHLNAQSASNSIAVLPTKLCSHLRTDTCRIRIGSYC